MGNVYSREDIIKELNEYRIECSEDGWDGYHAPAISERIIDKSLDILKLIPDDKLPRFIAPTGMNSIQFEYEHLCSNYLEFEISEEKLELFRCWDLENDGHYSKEITEDEMLKYIEIFLK